MSVKIEKDKNLEPVHSNPDAITGAPGSHPVSTGIGSAAGAATGAAIGVLGGPIGIAIGIIAGGVAGGLIGKGVGEIADPTDELAYWRHAHKGRDYVLPEHDFDRDLAPAYRYGGAIHAGLSTPADAYLNDDDTDKFHGSTGAVVDEDGNLTPSSGTTPVSTPIVGSPPAGSAGSPGIGTPGAGMPPVGASPVESNSLQTNMDRPVPYQAPAGRGTESQTKDSRIGDNQHDYNTLEEEIRAGWDKVKDKSTLTYEQARQAIRDAYERRREAAQRDRANKGFADDDETE